MRIPTLSLLAFLLLACDSGAPKQESGTETTTAPESAEMVSNEHAAFPVPVFTTFAGLEQLFQKQNDTTYVINFWATWCKPCVKELPYFEKLTENYRGQKVRVVLVSLDFAKDLEKKLLPFLEERQLQSDVVVLLDGNYNNWIDKVDPSWSGAIPATLVYGGSERKFLEASFDDYDQLDNLLQSIL